MRTLRWRTALIGALAILLGSTLAWQRLAASSARSGSGVEVAFGVPTIRYTTAVDPIVFHDHIAIPVLGVRAASLHDGFEASRGDHVHHAIDIPAPRGTPVIAAVDGTVARLYTSHAGGLTVYELDPAGGLVYYYAHLDHYADRLAEGQPLRRGEVIGYVGTTGNAPPNFPHLHFAIEQPAAARQWWNGTPLNPFPVLVARGVTYSAE